ncbi:hypothetical protein A2767_01800 [Candidatus Roizmanbacteria bacterium RIFCSPHIGHO2_01_FULL_35_10]|nr:MAG: hypothetical protein A2767_01800 [Candidatus Roizmanbacteria bacterium RIFCSPHIGHO2_01_FULL_35_10]
MILTEKIIKLSKHYKTPFLLFDLKQIKKNYLKLKKNIDGVEICYAMKANDHPKILQYLAKEGSSFEISSLNELRTLLRLKINQSRIICFNPIKSPEFLEAMAIQNIKIMAYDSVDEINKIAKFAPKSEVVLRIIVSNEDSDWPLTKKFGADAKDALEFLLYAKKKGLKPIGLTCHVGSQCLNKDNWVKALHVYNDIWIEAQKRDINLTLLSLGGGIPIQHTKPIPTINEIGQVINQSIRKHFKDKTNSLRITLEPGRGLVGDAAIMTTTVTGKAVRGKEKWIYIDVGILNGLMETIANFTYQLSAESTGKKQIVTIGGPSCDSIDIPFNKISLPKVNIGDRLYILNTGAYTTVYASTFNGFEVPKIYFVNS